MWPNPQETADLFTFTEEILNGKLHFLWINFWLFLPAFLYRKSQAVAIANHCFITFSLDWINWKITRNELVSKVSDWRNMWRYARHIIWKILLIFMEKILLKYYPTQGNSRPFNRITKFCYLNFPKYIQWS